MASLTAAEGLSYLLTSSNHDLELTCGSQVFRVHKDLLAAKSPFWAACVQSQLKDPSEARLTIRHQDPYVVALYILFVYTGEVVGSIGFAYPFIEATRLQAGDAAHFETRKLAELYALAEEWLLPELKDAVGRKLMTWHALPQGPHHGNDAPFIPQTVQVAEAFTKHLVILLHAIYNHVPEGDPLRARATTLGFSWWKGHQDRPNSLPSETVAPLMELMRTHERVATASLTMAWELWGDIEGNEVLLRTIRATVGGGC